MSSCPKARSSARSIRMAVTYSVSGRGLKKIDKGNTNISIFLIEY